MAAIYPTLSSFGWVNGIADKLDFLLTDMFYADKLQTSLYGSKVTSVQWILEQNTDSMLNTASAMQSAINNYLRRYYDSASVEVTYQDADPGVSSSRVQLTIFATVVEDGVEYQVNKLALVVDGRFKEFIALSSVETT